MADDDDDGNFMEVLNRTFALVAFDVVYPLLGDLTFRTRALDVAPEAARELLTLCRQTQRGQSLAEASLSLQFPALADLIVTLDATIKEHFKDGVFAKLSDFSPKDVTWPESQFEAVYELKLGQLSEQLVLLGLDLTKIDNLHLQALIYAKAAMHRQESGREIIKLFAQSERIADELERKLEMVATAEPVQIVLREWVDLDPAFEFRGFVVNNRLAGLSQMATMGIGPPCYPQLLALREQLATGARQFYETQLAPRLADLSRRLDGLFICDLYFHWATQRWYVVELNPWITSGAGHRYVADMAQLAQGRLPFELRLLETTSPAIWQEPSLPADWRLKLEASSDTWWQ